MFETYIYAPFFNILVGLYMLLGGISPDWADMGIAVIIFSIVVRLITFPLTLAGEQSEEEKRKIVEQAELLKSTYAHEPIRLKAELKALIRGNARTVFATTANILIQLAIILMLYRIFTTGLEGRDFYLLYSFIPDPGHINLLFLGKYDLSHTNATLNMIQSIMIFVVEVLSALRSPFPLSRKDKTLLQLVLPLGSFVVFMFMPSGKKVFIITSLAFSTLYLSVKLIQDWGNKLMVRLTPRSEAETPSVVEGQAPPVTPTTEPSHSSDHPTA